jgi:hypothetical protein
LDYEDMQLEELSIGVIQRLSDLGYPNLNNIRLFGTEPGNSVKELRGILEEFVRGIAQMAYVRKGIQFRGDATRLSEVRQFINGFGWRTDAESITSDSIQI